MIGKPAKPGEKTIGLLHYLYRLNSHHKDPHVIGGFQSAAVLESPLKPNGKPDLQKLAQVLEAPLALADTSGLKDGSKLVYHFCFRAAPGDRRMDDEEWMVLAREAMHRLGLAPRGRENLEVPWVAVRHADDHIHVVAVRVRPNGQVVHLWQDRNKLIKTARWAEKKFGLQEVGSPDGTTRHQATRAETAKAARTQQPGPSRTILAEHIEAVAAAVVDEESFFAGLADRGLLIRYRRSPDRHRRITGYAVGLPGDLRRDGSQAWFSGSTLAPYLSLLKLRRRWDGGSPLAGHYMQAPAAKAVLRREVTAAAAASTTEDGFLAALKARNLDTEIRYAPDRPGTRTGYTVGMPGLTRRDGTPRRYAGGTLDPNLTLGQLRARWRAGLPGAAPPGLYDGADAAALVYFCAADETRPPGELDEAIRSLRERADRLVYLAKGYRSASARAAELAENAPVTL